MLGAFLTERELGNKASNRFKEKMKKIAFAMTCLMAPKLLLFQHRSWVSFPEEV
jgi:hypothetical protein